MVVKSYIESHSCNIPSLLKIVVGRTALLYRRQYPGAVPGRIRDHHANTLDLITKSAGVLWHDAEHLLRSGAGLLRRVPAERGPTGVFVGPYSLWSKKEDAEKVRMEDDEKCVVWLDTQEVGSVVFVGFGSFCCFSKEQHWEMAWGLEASGRPFLWALKEKKLAGDSAPWLPEGFEERVAILNHPATGAFVTYLGWSSLNGGSDRRKVGLNILRVGLRMWDGYRSSLPEEAAEAVEVEAVRKRAAACRATTRAAVKEGGTAYNDLTRLIDGQKAFSPEAEWGESAAIPKPKSGTRVI
ncbi:unnamed protein product [Spirodela intermedia]|uniref:Uncharacterized protein n=1 Tax=Spirodela intermedia TaxID=51605 RepID=A0A7I8IL16_SPIIN|nr:unnamed protein product [Spirodela intermedia]CAA6658591.1 unnamed protein product [Spirodela intermedia]